MNSKIQQTIILFLFIIIGFSQNLKGQTMGFTVGMDSAAVGGMIDIPITVANFNTIQGYQGTISFDTAVVDFISLTSPTSGISNIFGSPGMGLIPLDAATFTWVDFSGVGKTFPNGTEAMRLTLQVKNGAAPGTYPVTMNSSVTLLGYTIGTGIITPTVTQGSLTVNGCVPTADPGFLFSSSACQNGFNPQAIIIGVLGGTFSVDNGASVNTTAGILDLSSTTAGNTYNVTYTTQGSCPNNSVNPVYVKAADDASFTIADTVCISGSNPGASITGLTGGFFSVDNGAMIDPSSGVFDLTSTMSNTTYNITYQTQGDCPEISTQSIFVADSTIPSFTFPDTICIQGTNPIPVVTGTSGGVFAQLFGASFTVNSVTGEVDITSLSAGQTYTLSYDIAGFCSSFNDHNFYVKDTLNASFLYPTALCPGSPNPISIITGDLGGSFSVSPSATINAVTGELDLSTLTQDTIYIVSYGFNDICQSSSQVQFVMEDLIAPDSASLPMISGECNVSVPTPLTIDNCAGSITGTTNDSLSYSEQGTYSITWTFDDGNGNQTIQTQMVVVQDTTPPTVSIQDIVVYLDSSGNASISAMDLDMGSVDNCGIDTMQADMTSFDCGDIGPNSVMVTITDEAGNPSQGMAMVTVEDSIVPVIVCQDYVINFDTTSMDTVIIDASMIDGGSSDACGIMSMEISQDTFTTANIGDSIEVTLTVIDNNGNEAICTAMVTAVNTTSIKELDGPELTLNAFPNPVNDQLQLEWKSPWQGEVTISVINIWGQIVLQEQKNKTASEWQTAIEMGNLAEGIYIIQMRQKEYTHTMRVMKK